MISDDVYFLDFVYSFHHRECPNTTTTTLSDGANSIGQMHYRREMQLKMWAETGFEGVVSQFESPLRCSE
jgi:hypothetical protein